MSEANNVDTVRVHYVKRFVGGKVFDTSIEKEAIRVGIQHKGGETMSLLVPEIIRV